MLIAKARKESSQYMVDRSKYSRCPVHMLMNKTAYGLENVGSPSKISRFVS